jgi:hypothetical protein
MRRTWMATTAIATCLALAGGPVAAQSPAPARLATPALVRYEDPVGDAAGGLGPDIVAVTLSQPEPGSVSIAVEFAAEPPLTYDLEAGWTDMLMVLGSTRPEGVVASPTDGVESDFVTGLHGANLEESVEQGAPLNVTGQTEPATADVTVAGNTVTLTLGRQSLGDPERITFLMWVFREWVSDAGTGGDEGTGGDAFPDNPEAGPYTQVAWTFPDD